MKYMLLLLLLYLSGCGQPSADDLPHVVSTYTKDGCLQAAVATITGLSPNQVPHFFSKSWAEHSWPYGTIKQMNKKFASQFFFAYVPAQYYIDDFHIKIIRFNDSEGSHAVIGHGHEIIYDPSGLDPITYDRVVAQILVIEINERQIKIKNSRAIP